MSVIIRDACISDAPRLLEIYSYYVQHTAISFEYTTPTQEEFCRRMRHIMSRYPYLVAEVDGTVQGYAYAGAFVGRAAYDWSCELTIYLARDARKMGLGRQLYTALEQRLAMSWMCSACSRIRSICSGSFSMPRTIALYTA